MFRDFLPSLRKQSLATKRPTSIADFMEDFWRDPFGSFPAFPFSKEQGFPSVDISETGNEIMVKAELPGLDPKDVEITLHDNMLIIEGEKKFKEEEKKDNYYRIERSYGSFSRAIQLPTPVKEEGVKAKFEKGVLTITINKAEKAVKKTIQIES